MNSLSLVKVKGRLTCPRGERVRGRKVPNQTLNVPALKILQGEGSSLEKGEAKEETRNASPNHRENAIKDKGPQKEIKKGE